MDYVREELLRQRRVLEALLSGTVPEQEKEENTDVERSASAPQTEWERTAAGTVPEKNTERRGSHRMSRAEVEREGRMGGMAEGAEWFRVQNLPNGAVSAGTEQADVRVVSRAVQRDARRYDGGFSIY